MQQLKQLLRKEPTSFLFAKLWNFSTGRRKKVILHLLLFVCANLIALLGPFIFGVFINEIQAHGITAENMQKLLLILGLMLGTTFLFWAFHGIARIIERMNAFYIRYQYQTYLVEGVLDRSLSWHGVRDSGDTIDKINKATDGLYHFSDRTFLIVEIVVRIIGTAVVLCFFNLYIGLFVLPGIIFALIILFQFDRYLVAYYKKLNFFENRVSAKIFDALSNVTSIIILNVVSPIAKNIRRVMLRPLKVYRKNIFVNEMKWFTGDFMFNLLIVLPMAFYILYVYRNNIIVEVGTISALYLYLSRLSEVFFTFGSFYEQVIVDKTAVLNAAEIEASFTQSTVHRNKVDDWDTLQLSDVHFRYAETDASRSQLENLSVAFKKGERIAVIGESGSGKTTFLKVLHGLYEDATGGIAFDARGVQKTNFFDIDLHTMLVPQEPELFSATIRENITFGVEYPEEEVQEAVRLAQFSDVVEQLPRGMESAINEKGVNLSGGQKQRLALARALLFAQGKDIILMDESTSSVDPRNEGHIYENILKAFDGKTIIASIHKMNLLKYFDRILIFEAGSIVDDGTFDDLMRRNEGFRQAWDAYVRESKD